MTIRFITAWDGYSADQIVTLSSAEETRLISIGFAVADLDGPGNTPVPVAERFRFDNFAPSILPSLVIGATYAQSGNTVTVTATAHGLPTNRNGYRIFWPGSALVTAGWYLGYAYVDANTYTFQNPTAQTVAGGTAITGTLPYTTATDIASITIPGGTLYEGREVRIPFLRSGDTTSTSKALSSIIDGAQKHLMTLTTNPATKGALSFSVISSGYVLCGSAEGTNASAANTTAKDLRADTVISLRCTLGAANAFMSIDNCYLEII